MSKTWNRLEALCERHDGDLAHCGALAVPYTAHGDYVGSLVEKANCQEILEDSAAAALDLVRPFYGGYGSEWVVLRREWAVDAIRDASNGAERREVVDALREIVEEIESLGTYPLLNEERHSELESEALAEFLADWLRWEAPEHIRDLSDSERDRVAGQLATEVWDRVVHENCTVCVRDSDMLEALEEVQGVATE